MSDFNLTYQKVLANESGYAPAFGASGETYKGIDRKYNSAWPGWQIVDTYKHLHGTPARGATIDNAQLESYVKQFYYNYLNRLAPVTQIANQTLADFVADFLIHKLYDAVKVINATAGMFNVQSSTNTAVVTPVLQLMNAKADDYYKQLYVNRIAYYNNPKIFGSVYNGFSPDLVKAFVDRVRKFPAALAASNNPIDWFKTIF